MNGQDKDLELNFPTGRLSESDEEIGSGGRGVHGRMPLQYGHAE